MTDACTDIGLYGIVDRVLIPHQNYLYVQQRLEQLFQRSSHLFEPACLAVFGESRTGKSRSIEEFCSQHPPSRNDDGLTVPILSIKIPSKPTVKSLVEILLSALGDPLSDKGTENAKTARLRRLLVACNVRVIVLDEFQHFYDRGSHKVLHHLADWLKVLVDDCRIALVVVGLPTCQAILSQNEQLAGRFLTPITMHRFDWLKPTDRAEFVAILEAFHEALSKYFDIPLLSSPELAFRCYLATGGLMGYLTKLLRQATWNTLDTGQSFISLPDLVRAEREAIQADDASVSPFSQEFKQHSPPHSLVAQALELGAHVPPPITPRRMGRPQTTTPTAAELMRG